MSGGGGPPATASGAGVPYTEWPAQLGDPRWHRLDHGGPAAAKTRADIVAQYRQRRPEAHAPAAAKHQLARVQELEKTKFARRLCSFQVQCCRGRATKKCLHCVQFDALKLGFYCDACFVARHPPYRLDHTWTPIEGTMHDVIQEQSWMTHIAHHNLEQDAHELQLLLSQTQAFLQASAGHGRIAPPRTAPSRPSTRAYPRPPPPAATAATPAPKMRTATGELDFQRVKESVSAIATTLKQLVEQIHAELAKKPLTREDALRRIQAMWRIRRARKQMRELLQSVYQSFTDPATGRTYYFNKRTGETKWSKPKGLGSADLAAKQYSNQDDAAEPQRKRGVHASKLKAITSEEERQEYAAKAIQGMARAHHAKRHFRSLISSVYEKIWDPASLRFYYHNTKTDAVKWEKPRWVSDDELLTPRTRDARKAQELEELQRQKLVQLRSRMTLDDAASMVQRAFRRRRGFRVLLDMCRGVYERLYDAEADMYYYHNTRTKEVSWDKPLLLRNAEADVFTPRTREQRLHTLLSSAAARTRIEWTEESAAVRLQGLFRARCARRDLDARLVQAYRKVWDPSSQRFYYANLETGAVSWDRPAILLRRQGVDVNELVT